MSKLKHILKEKQIKHLTELVNELDKDIKEGQRKKEIYLTTIEKLKNNE